MVQLPQAFHDARERVVVGAQLNLRGAMSTTDRTVRSSPPHLASDVKDEVAALEGLEPLREPVEVGLEVLHAEEHGAVRPQIMSLHDVLYGHKRRDRQRARVRQDVVGRVEVHDVDRSAESCQELDARTSVRWIARE